MILRLSIITEEVWENGLLLENTTSYNPYFHYEDKFGNDHKYYLSSIEMSINYPIKFPKHKDEIKRFPLYYVYKDLGITASFENWLQDLKNEILAKFGHLNITDKRNV